MGDLDCYYDGDIDGVAEDKKEAVRWFRLSDDQGNLILELYTVWVIATSMAMPLVTPI